MIPKPQQVTKAQVMKFCDMREEQFQYETDYNYNKKIDLEKEAFDKEERRRHPEFKIVEDIQHQEDIERNKYAILMRNQEPVRQACFKEYKNFEDQWI